MCGIAGFVGKGDRDILLKMTDALKHRGPDSDGILVRDDVYLGHRRLAVIDLSPGGHQPMFDARADLAISYNGEIYNYQKLRGTLEKEHGVVFTSASDTEVILKLYTVYKEDAFEKLEGMFAIALYDFKNKRLLLARDRLGKKPLYWTEQNGILGFASELKALIKHPGLQLEIDPRSVYEYFFFEYVPTPKTIYKNIQKLEPGTYCVFEKGVKFMRSFWQTSFTQSEISFSEAKEKLDSLLEKSVQDRMISDVPLGVFLSGGIDSSTVAYYAQKLSTQKVKTFSIAFSETSFDESSHARRVAEHLGTEHHELLVSAKDMINVCEHMADLIDEPMADASIIPTSILSKFTKGHVTVALGGDGADELLAGYPTFNAEFASRYFRTIPESVRNNIVRPLVHSIPASHKNMGLAFKLQKFIEGTNDDIFMRHQQWLSAYPESELTALFTPEFLDQGRTDLKQNITQYTAPFRGADEKNLLLYSYLRTYLMDLVLVKVDRASMAHGLEVRTPFLDHTLVDFIHSLPYEYKHHRFKPKHLLKELMINRLPQEIVDRAKKGFGIPLAEWLRKDLKEYSEEVLSESALGKVNIFDVAHITRLLQEHEKGLFDHRKKLWPVIVFMVWHRNNVL